MSVGKEGIASLSSESAEFCAAGFENGHGAFSSVRNGHFELAGQTLREAPQASQTGANIDLGPKLPR
jgi:hypothetical protein